MKSKKNGFNPTNYKVFGILSGAGRFVMDEEFVIPITSIVVASEWDFDDRWHPIEHIYLADVYDDDEYDVATLMFNPEDVEVCFVASNISRMLRRIWDDGNFDIEYVSNCINNAVAVLDTNGIAVSPEVREFISQPISLDLIARKFPDKARWSKEETQKQ